MTDNNQQIQYLLQTAHPDVFFKLSGDGCHFQVLAVSKKFADMKKIARQQLLNKVLADKIADGTIHAVSYTIYTPEEAKQKGLSWIS